MLPKSKAVVSKASCLETVKELKTRIYRTIAIHTRAAMN